MNKSTVKLTNKEKIEVIEFAIEKAIYRKEKHKFLYMCHCIEDALIRCEIMNKGDDDLLDILQTNFSELCKLAQKYINLSYYDEKTRIIFDKLAWFDGEEMDLRISLLKELLEVYKKQSD